MNFNIKNSINLKYDLVSGAPQEVIPYKYNDHSDLYILKSKECININSGRLAAVETGIIIQSLPQFVVNQNSANAVNMQVIAKCISHPDLLIDNGIEVLGPIDILSNEEIVVNLYNRSKTIFSANPGDAICLLEFDLKPLINFEIDINKLTIPENMR